MRDLSTWLDDLTVHVSDDEVRSEAAAIEQMLAYDRSRILAVVWLALLGTFAGLLGGLVLSPQMRASTPIFLLYVMAIPALLRLTHPATKRLIGEGLTWPAGLTMFWAFLLGLAAVLGARIDSLNWGYGVGAAIGAFVGLMCGSLAASTAAREDIYLAVSLVSAPLTVTAGTFLARALSPDTELYAAAIAGAVGGGVFSLAAALALATMWNPANGFMKLGLLYLHNEHFTPQAVDYLTRAIALRPKNAQLYNLRGIAYSKIKDTARADVDFAKTTAMSPGHAEPAMNRGLGHLERNETELAIAALEMAAKINPRTPKLQSNLGVAYERIGDLDRAIAHYDEAVRQSPRHANAYSNRAFALHRKGEHQRALEDCDKALKIRPDLLPALVNRGHALRGLGRIDHALASYQEALDTAGEATFHDEARQAIVELGGVPDDDDPRDDVDDERE